MPQPPPDPPVADTAPDSEVLTRYDEEHLVTYLRLLDADAEGADWTEVACLVLHIDPSREPERARRAWETHLARAKWMTEHGYRHLLRGGDN
jgi:T6SS, Transcription factor, DNA binding domain